MWRNLPPKCVSSIINSHNLKLQNTARHRARRSKAPCQFWCQVFPLCSHSRAQQRSKWSWLALSKRNLACICTPVGKKISGEKLTENHCRPHYFSFLSWNFAHKTAGSSCFQQKSSDKSRALQLDHARNRFAGNEINCFSQELLTCKTEVKCEWISGRQ